jgi:hypothetical protein
MIAARGKSEALLVAAGSAGLAAAEAVERVTDARRLADAVGAAWVSRRLKELVRLLCELEERLWQLRSDVEDEGDAVLAGHRRAGLPRATASEEPR